MVPDICGIPGWAQSKQSWRSGLAAQSCGRLQPSLKLLIWWLTRQSDTFSKVGSIFCVWDKACWWQINGPPIHHELDTVTTSPVISLFCCMGLCAQTEWAYLEFQFMATVFMSMATRLNDLDNQKLGINIQTEHHTHTPPSGWNGPEDPEVFRSAPSQSPSQSLARKPDCHEIEYCLEIQVTSTEDKTVTPPPSYAWQVPTVEDMVWDGKAGLTEAIVTGPGQAILFYRHQSLGEGLIFGKAWDTMFTLPGTISWVSKQA